MRRVLAMAAVVVVALATGVSRAAIGGSGVAWSKAQAEARILRSPPRHWKQRGWTVAAAVCAGTGPARGLRLYPNFSCEITVVRPAGNCPSFGIYTCVAGWEYTAEERTLHVLDKSRYALYRVPQ